MTGMDLIRTEDQDQEKSLESNNNEKTNKITVKIKIRTKFLSAFLAIIIPAAIIIGYNALVASINSNKADVVVAQSLPQAFSFIDLEKDVILIQSWLQNIALTKGAAKYDQGFTKAEQHYHAAVKKINTLIEAFKDSPDELKQIKQMKNDLKNYYDLGKVTADTYIQSGPEAGNAMLETFSTVRDILNKTLNKYRDTETTGLIEELRHISHELQTTLKTSILSVIIFIGLGIALALFMTGMLVKPVNIMNKRLYDISEGEGDLTVQLKINSRDELGEVAASFNNFISKIRNVIKDAQESSEILGSAAEEINNTAHIFFDYNTAIITNTSQLTVSDTVLVHIPLLVLDKTKNNKFNIYPNPTTGQITIEGKNIEQIEIYNLSGVLIQSTNKKEINLSQEAKGIYFVKVTTANGVTTQKLIVE